MCRRILLVLAGILSVSGTVRRGSVTVTVLDTTIEEGQTGIVRVLISGDAGGTLLQSTQFEFRIEPLAATHRLDFAIPTVPDPTLSKPNYVFLGDSFDFIIGGKSLGNRSGVTVPNDTYKGGDSTYNEPYVTLSAPRLLAELPIMMGPSNLAPTAGETYKISLISPSPFTGFTDADGDPLDITSASFVPGIVTITPLAAVPEPASLSLLASAGITMTFYGLAGKGENRHFLSSVCMGHISDAGRVQSHKCVRPASQMRHLRYCYAWPNDTRTQVRVCKAALSAPFCREIRILGRRPLIQSPASSSPSNGEPPSSAPGQGETAIGCALPAENNLRDPLHRSRPWRRAGRSKRHQTEPAWRTASSNSRANRSKSACAIVPPEVMPRAPKVGTTVMLGSASNIFSVPPTSLPRVR